MTRDQMRTSMLLEKEKMHPVHLPITNNTPVPGLILMADVQHTKLVVVEPDGRVIDLLEVHRLAEDCIRNWHKGDNPLKLPHFVGDFKRLTSLAVALNGRKIEGEPS